jgi:hypothetical protein
VAHTCNPSYLGDRSGGLRFEASRGKYFVKPYLKDTQLKKKKKKKAGGVIQAVGPSSNPSTELKKKKKICTSFQVPGLLQVAHTYKPSYLGG